MQTPRAALRLGLLAAPVKEVIFAFTLLRGCTVDPAVFDVRGALVARVLHGERAAGPHRATWDDRTDAGLPALPGVYLARLVAGGGTVMRGFVQLRESRGKRTKT
jgi:hypothetical protein